jgi:hypothetical protein
MTRIFQASFFCHCCSLENTITFSCSGDYFEASKKASTLLCPSGCNPQKFLFELTRLEELEWESAFEANDVVFH